MALKLVHLRNLSLKTVGQQVCKLPHNCKSGFLTKFPVYSYLIQCRGKLTQKKMKAYHVSSELLSTEFSNLHSGKSKVPKKLDLRNLPERYHPFFRQVERDLLFDKKSFDFSYFENLDYHFVHTCRVTPSLFIKVDHVLLKLILEHWRYDVALTLHQHLKNQRREISPYFIASLMSSYGASAMPDKDEVIKDLYSEIKQFEKKDLVREVLTRVVRGLTRSSHWLTGLELIENNLGNGIYECPPRYLSEVLYAALDNKNPEIFLQVFKKMMNTGTMPDNWILTEYFLALNHFHDDSIYWEKIFKLIKENGFDWMASKTTADAISDYFRSCMLWKDSKWEAKWATAKSARCSVCGHRLEKIELSPSDFELMKKNYFEKFIVGDSIYIRTTPEEMENIDKILKSEGPFDVIIDGLNVVHREGFSQKDAVGILEYFKDRNQHILVIMRQKQMNHIKKLIRQYACIFDADVLSADDIFLVYSAFHSGINTYIVTNDELRDAKAVLSRSAKTTFLKWQQTRQIRLFKGKLEFPFGYNPVLQEDENGWHIPYKDEDEITLPEAYRMPSYHSSNKHLCLRKIK